MSESSGSAMREMEKIEQSLEYRLNALRETWVGVAQNLFQTEELGIVIDFLKILSEVVDRITGQLGLLGTVGLTALIVKLVKLKGSIAAIQSAVTPVMKAVSNINMDGSADSALKYAMALEDLDIAQQKVVMSSMGLSAEQQESVMAMIQRIALTKDLTISEFEVALGLEADSVATAANAASNAKMTVEVLRAALAKKGLGAKILENIGLIKAESGAMAAETVTAKALEAARKAAFTAMLKSPMTWISVAITLLPVLVKGISSLIVTQKEAYESAENLRSKYVELKEEIKSLTEEIETNKDRIGELQSLSDNGTITLVEQEELDRLILTNDELLITISRLKELAALDAEETNKGYRKSYNKEQYENIWNEEAYKRAHDWQVGIQYRAGQNFGTLSAEMYAEQLIKEYTELNELQESGIELTEDQAELFEIVRERLVRFSNELDKDYLQKYIGEDEFTDGIHEMLDAINAIIYPVEYFNTKLKELPESAVEGLNALGRNGEVTAEHIEDLIKQFPDLKTWMDACGYSAEDVASNFNALSVIQAEAGGSASRYKAELEGLSETLSGLKSAYDILNTAEEEMADGGGLSPETIASLAKEEENYLDYLYEENGLVKLNTALWKENANARMNGEIDKIQSELSALEEERRLLKEERKTLQDDLTLLEKDSDKGIGLSVLSEEEYKNRVEETTAALNENSKQIEENTKLIEENQAKLAIYGVYYNQIVGDLDAYTSALNNFTSIHSEIDDISKSFQTLADIQAEVANGFVLTLDKALEFASAYPEILNSATVTADGQIQLNQGVVDSFIAGKQNELNAVIDSRIQELNAEKAVLEGRVEAAQARLELAKNLAEGETAIAAEKAQYELDVDNALTQAFIDNGIEEVTANELAAAAKADNEAEFVRIACEAFANMDENAAKAAYNMAHNIYVNSKNSASSISQIAKQAHEAAKAIEAAGRGEVAGSSRSLFSGSDGITGSSADINLYDGNFKGHEYNYEGKTMSLDDYVSAIELDISTYENAIAQIDGQIAVLQALKSKPLGVTGDGSGSGGGGGSDSSKEIEEYIVDIDEYRKALERLNRARRTTAEIQDKLSESDGIKEQLILQKELIDAYGREQEALLALNKQRSSTITAGAEALRGLGFEVSYNAEKNELWIENLEHINDLVADNAGEYDTLQEATNALRKGTEDLINSLSDLNESNRDGTDDWRELRDSIEEAHEQVQTLLKDIVDSASEAVDSLQDVYDTLHEAADEYADTGYVTIDTLQKIIDLGVEYVAYLRDEDGQLVINEERIRDIIAAKTEELAVESAMSYVTALRIAQEENDIETLDRLLYATQKGTEATWDLVYANLQLMGLSDEQYDSALANVNAIRAIAENAIRGIGQMTTSTKDELQSMKDGLDDILKYVMDMLKQRINEQVDALNDMKDAYSEIIDLKKESLDKSKEEADRQKALSSKMKEIAKLQARIDALSLDDSRAAQAERAKLLEDMEKLQEDLANSQSDYMIDTTKESLDKMEDAYHAEKDREIEILEDSISSYQKLYDMAIEYISNNWDTLYNELILYNESYGQVLNEEITTAWNNALEAAQRYGDYVSAMNNIDSDISVASTSGQSLTVGNTYYSDKIGDAEMVGVIVGRMKAYSAQWSASNTSTFNDSLHDKAAMEADKLDQYGVHAEFNAKDGTWVITSDENNPSNVGKLLYKAYHSGGIVGGGGIRTNEEFALLRDKEWVLSEKMVDNLTAQMGRLKQLRDSFGSLPDYISKSALAGILNPNGVGTVNNVTNNSNQPVKIEIGETRIYGANGDTVQQHISVTRDMVNQIARLLKIGM